MLSQGSPSSSQQPLFHHYHPPQPLLQPLLLPPPTTSFLNDQFLLSAAALAASHSYPPPSSFLSSLAASNLLSSINAHIHSISPEQQATTNTNTAPDYLTNFNDPYGARKKVDDQHTSTSDVKDLIGSSLTALGLDNVNEDEFDKAATNEQNSELLLIDNDIESFERSTTPATNNTSPTHLTTVSSSSSSTANPMTRPMNIPNSFTNDRFSHSSSAKSPFDTPNQLFEQTLESVCFDEHSTFSFISFSFIYSQSIHLFQNLRHPVVVVNVLVNYIKWLVLVRIYQHLPIICIQVLHN